MAEGNAVGGGKDLVGELYERYANDVLRVSYFYLGNRQQAEDVMQETFIRLMTKNPVLEEGKEKAWLLTVALNLCRDQWRSGWFKRVVLGDEVLEMIPASDGEIERRMEKEALMQAVHTLPPDTRDVFLLHYYQGYGIEEIAHMLGTAPGTIASRLSRGRAKLKTKLTGGEA